MFEVFKRVKTVFDKDYAGFSEEFKKGFRMCFDLFEIGYRKVPNFNFEVEANNIQKELEKVNEELVTLQRTSNEKINRLTSELNSLLGENVQASTLKRKTRLTLFHAIHSDLKPHEIVNQLKSLTNGWDINN